jgi:hypothetical protein
MKNLEHVQSIMAILSFELSDDAIFISGQVAQNGRLEDLHAKSERCGNLTINDGIFSTDSE